MQNKKISWFFSGLEFAEKNLKAGDVVEIQIMRTGQWQHPEYGYIEVSAKDLKDFKTNFDNDVRGVELAVDENHEGDHKALGWYKELNINGDKLFAKIELTAKGAELVNQGAYRYFSPEYINEYVDEETGELVTNLLLGGAFTNRPFFKGMKPLMASEKDSNDFIILFNNEKTMKEIKEFSNLLSELKDKEVINADEKASIEKMFSELPEAYQGEDGYKADYESVIKKFTDESGKGEAPADEPKEEEKKEDEDVKEDEKPADEAEILADKPADEVEAEESPEEEEKPAEEVAEEPKAEDKPADEVVEATEKQITVKASEWDSKTKEMAELKSKISKYETEIAKKEITEKVNSFVCSESNHNGRILPKQKDSLVELLTGLSKDKRDKVLAFVESLPKVEFKEVGAAGADVDETPAADKLIKKAEKYAEKNSVAYDIAFSEVCKKNPDLFSEYKKEY
jgi:hypothetical protein